MEWRRGLAMGILSVRLSVRLSVTRVNCDKTVERSVQITIRKIIYPSFLRRRMVGLGQPTLVGAKSLIFNQ